jgi:hypothetical protein
MTRLALLLLLVACASAQARPAKVQAGRPVTGDRAYLTEYDVPPSYRHLVRDLLTGPYYFAFSGPYACVITAERYTMLKTGDWLTCDWRAPR